MAAYYAAPIPEPGCSWELHTPDTQQALDYSRPQLSEALGAESRTRVAISTAEAEAAEQLAIWSVATLCRTLSLPNILTFLAGSSPIPPQPCHTPCFILSP